MKWTVAECLVISIYFQLVNLPKGDLGLALEHMVKIHSLLFNLVSSLLQIVVSPFSH